MKSRVGPGSGRSIHRVLWERGSEQIQIGDPKFRSLFGEVLRPHGKNAAHFFNARKLLIRQSEWRMTFARRVRRCGLRMTNGLRGSRACVASPDMRLQRLSRSHSHLRAFIHSLGRECFSERSLAHVVRHPNARNRGARWGPRFTRDDHPDRMVT